MSQNRNRELAGGRYQLHEIAGRGGMAVVWRGIQRGDLGFHKKVAVKQIHDHLADKPLYVEMFAEEARVGAELHSPNIAQIYDFVAERGEYFLVMEWVEGIESGIYDIRRCEICDRYLDDTRIDFALNFPEEHVETWWLWRFAVRFAPQPDVAFLHLP